MRIRLLWPHVAMLLILLVCSGIYYTGYITRLPFGMHDWAQADRLALAVNFYDNGLDFFHPATSNLASPHGIVGVEAPLQPFIVAIIAQVTGRDSISIVFRLLDILIALTGLYFLFRAVWNRTRDFVFSLFAPIFIFCSPVYVFYTGNYLPDPAAASIMFIAFYCLLEAMRTAGFRPLLTSIALATLATLIKASAAPYLAGIFCYSFYCTIRNKQYRHAQILAAAALVSGLVLRANLHHIRYLNEHYHSTLFLSTFNPFKSWEAFWSFAENNYKHGWLHEYFLLAQYPLYAMLLGLGGRAFAQQHSLRVLLTPVPVFFGCAIIVFWLFGEQYEMHDYYFIPTFLPLAAYSLVVALIAIGALAAAAPQVSAALRTGLLCAIIMTFFFADFQVSQRMCMTGEYAHYYSFKWAVGGKQMLQRLHIPDTERIVVANDAPPNLALVYFDRKGYHISPLTWSRDVAFAKQFADERSVHTIVMKTSLLAEMHAKDSNAFNAAFSVLGVQGDKAVLHRK